MSTLAALPILAALLTFTFAAVCLNAGERRHRREGRSDLAERVAVRAKAQEALARHECRPFAEIQVSTVEPPKRSEP